VRYTGSVSRPDRRSQIILARAQARPAQQVDPAALRDGEHAIAQAVSVFSPGKQIPMQAIIRRAEAHGIVVTIATGTSECCQMR